MGETTTTRIDVVDLGRHAYAPAYAEQERCVRRVLEARERGEDLWGVILLVEHEAVITVSRRAGARQHLLADAARLEREGVSVAETDRGGDITYHGPGQLVVYPIIDLNRAKLRIHDYMRLLEAAVIDVCAGYGLDARRDECATGVWIGGGGCADAASSAKICAMGVRIRTWVSMHGLALNVSTNLSHFDLIVPCGLAGRRVTSLQRELAGRCPTMAAVKGDLVDALRRRLAQAREGRSYSAP